MGGDDVRDSELKEFRDLLTNLRIDMATMNQKIDDVRSLKSGIDDIRDRVTSAERDAKSAHKRLDAMDENSRWLKRTVVGGIIASVLSVGTTAVMVFLSLK